MIVPEIALGDVEGALPVYHKTDPHQLPTYSLVVSKPVVVPSITFASACASFGKYPLHVQTHFEFPTMHVFQTRAVLINCMSNYLWYHQQLSIFPEIS